MLQRRYPVITSDDFETFEFDSVGPKGIIRKVVRYTKTKIDGLYNLGFGDKDSSTGTVSDTIVTANDDSLRVLATVGATLYAFTESHPQAFVIATGSTAGRTRLYRMGIAKYLTEIENDFFVRGLVDAEWEFFQKNVPYEAILVERKW